MSPSSSWSGSATASHAMAVPLLGYQRGLRPGLRAADLDEAVADPRRQWGCGWWAGPRTMWPSRTSNCGLVQRAGDHAVDHRAAGQQGARVAAHVVERVDARLAGASSTLRPSTSTPLGSPSLSSSAATVLTQRFGALLPRRVDHRRPGPERGARPRSPRPWWPPCSPRRERGRTAVPGEAGGQRRRLQQRWRRPLSRPWKRPTRRSSPSLTVQSATPVTAVATAAARPAALSVAAASSLTRGGGVVADHVEQQRPDQKPIGRSRARGAARARPSARRAATPPRGCRGTGRRRAARPRRRCR